MYCMLLIYRQPLISHFSRCKMTDKRPPVWASPWAMQQCSFFLFYPRVKTNSETTELVQSADEHSWLARVSCHSESVNVLTIFSIDSRFCRALMSSVRSCCESRWLQILHSAVYHCCKKPFQFQTNWLFTDILMYGFLRWPQNST